ncbi:hypothetical protein BSLG_003284 [Batrachochytrium salamandrivorans]|nr:hypothetical protein BSLG_008998 [Batrachochytrium salamandrivorans]KAJ1342157.1 hypothetical protein BSLG_003284 [Batrachochytrium salamandrivorans]
MAAPSSLSAAPSSSASLNGLPKATLTGYVGFDSITDQIQKKLVKRGFAFNLMVVGRSGLGKSTLVNTLFASHLVESKGLAPPRQTTEINSVQHLIEEKGIRLTLSVTDTPGYGDQVNNENCWDPIIKHIKDQYALYLRRELNPQRERRIVDSRIHAVIFFISPSGHSLTPLDITVMKKISEVANVIPIIAKADSLTIEERILFKRRIREEIDFHGIRLYPFTDIDEEFSSYTDDRADRQAAQLIRDMIPFAIVGSERNVVIDGKAVRGRRTRWGVINVEDETHCEFIHLRNFLTRTNLQDLIESTSLAHYETFRTRQLIALKESSGRVSNGDQQ